MRYIILSVFIVVYAFGSKDLGYSHDTPFYTHFTYMFQHAGILHLLFNSFAFFGLFRSLQNFIRASVFFPVALFSGFLASFLAVYESVTVGSSALVYAIVGQYIAVTLFSANVRIMDKSRYLLFLFSVFLCLLFSLFRQNSNFLVHLFSMLIGFILSLIYVFSKG